MYLKIKNNDEFASAKTLYFSTFAFGILSCIFVILSSRTLIKSIFFLGVYHIYITAFLIFLVMLKEYRWSAFNVVAVEIEVKKESSSETNEKKKEDTKKQYERFVKLFYPLWMTGISAILFFMLYSAILDIGKENVVTQSSFAVGAVCVVLSLLYMLGGNWFIYKNKEDYRSLGIFLKSNQYLCFIIGLATLLTAFGFPIGDVIMSYFMVVFITIILLETIVQSIYILILQKGEEQGLKQYVLSALTSGKNPVNLLFKFLEEKYGITLRSAWSMKFIRDNLIVMITLMVIIFWAMTAFIQINHNENAVLYRFGKLNTSKVLTPGIHFKMPWPIDTVKVYPVHSIKSFTVGFEAGNQENYLWTNKHSGEEYKLLLGDGKELVSINMIVYYNINNLFEYLHKYANPEEELKAKAYEFILKEITATNLDNLLSRDRASFAKTVAEHLQKTSVEKQLGIEVVNVALTSIHPPVEIAQEYQQIVGAKIKKQVIITNAEAYAEVSIPLAEIEKDNHIADSTVKALERRAEAAGEALKYSNQLEAYKFSPEAYKHWKWLEAFEKFMENKKAYIVDESLIKETGQFWLDLRREDSPYGAYYGN
jgi:regulator of protease activity HflC (stomatin/prohibitin superfamily)